MQCDTDELATQRRARRSAAHLMLTASFTAVRAEPMFLSASAGRALGRSPRGFRASALRGRAATPRVGCRSRYFGSLGGSSIQQSIVVRGNSRMCRLPQFTDDLHIDVVLSGVSRRRSIFERVNPRSFRALADFGFGSKRGSQGGSVAEAAS